MKKSVVFLSVLLFLISLPTYSASKSTRLILNELKKLNGIVKSLEQQIYTLNRKMLIVDEKVTAITKNQADSNQNREKIELSLQFIKEEINELKNKITKINDKLFILSSRSSTESNQTNDGTDQNPFNQSPENIYYTAYSDYLKKNYDLAIKGFNQFIKLFSSNGLADNSLYWVGECYYSQKMYQEAVNTFSKLINNYQDGDKIPAATLKKGFALIEMGKQSQGVYVLKELISKFPLSEEASLAQQKIREITD